MGCSQELSTDALQVQSKLPMCGYRSMRTIISQPAVIAATSRLPTACPKLSYLLWLTWFPAQAPVKPMHWLCSCLLTPLLELLRPMASLLALPLPPAIPHSTQYAEALAVLSCYNEGARLIGQAGAAKVIEAVANWPHGTAQLQRHLAALSNAIVSAV